MASTRSGFRPRPVDINRQLVIVRDLSEIDTIDGVLPKELDPNAAPTSLPEAPSFPVTVQGAPGQQPHHLPQLKKPKPKEIPVPEVKDVPTYTRNYLPTFKIPDTYIRGKGGYGYALDEYLEYDLDNEDEDWLAAFNHHDEHRLPDVKLERMLWRLELAWAEAVEGHTGGPPERAPAQVLASTAALPKVQALHVLRKAVGGRDIILEQVYEYWAGKRKRWGRPILRRLQPPTNPSDTNPYNVFRPREKANRPLTRRRRENSAECLEKLRQMRENMLRALQLAELVVLRERKKADYHQVDMTDQRYQLNIKHQPPVMHVTIEQQAISRLRDLRARTTLAEQRLAEYAQAQQNQSLAMLDAGVQRALTRKRRRLEGDLLAHLAVSTIDTLAKLPPPLLPADDEPLWAYQPNLLDLKVASEHGGRSAAAAPQQPAVQLPDGVAGELGSGTIQPYIGRGGRVVLARCDPLTLQPFNVASENGLANGGPVPPQPPSAELTDAEVLAYQPPSLQPWALAFDVSLLPDYIDKAPILAARQHWLQLQERVGRSLGGSFDVASSHSETSAYGHHKPRLPSWASVPGHPAPANPAQAAGRVHVSHAQPGAVMNGNVPA